jgi:xylulokinase
MPDLLIGIDVGTSSVKGLICDIKGRVISRVSVEHNLSSPKTGWSEEDAAVWIHNVIKVIRACLKHPDVEAKRIASVGVSGMVPAIVLLDQQGEVLRPAIMQNDARASREITELEQALSFGKFFSLTGARISQQSVGPRLLWLQRHEPGIWSKVHKVMGSYDYINYYLTGVQSVERNWALESGLFNLHEGTWSDELMHPCNLNASLFPAVRNPAEIIGVVSHSFAEVSGLIAGTPVAAGTADHVAAALAAGISQEGDLLLKFGSAGDMLYCMNQLVTEPRLFLDFHDFPGKFLLNGCMSTSGSLLKWFVNEFCQEDIRSAIEFGQDIYAYLDKKAAQISAGSEGLVVLPYFLGEKTPIFDANARGVFFGLTLSHTRYHIYRAIMEAVAYGFRHHIEVLQEKGLPIRHIITAEGGAKSPIWRQITADVIGERVEYLANDPSAAYGAALVAGMAIGAVIDWNDLELFSVMKEDNLPNEAHKELYERLYGVYKSLYTELQDLFPLL